MLIMTKTHSRARRSLLGAAVAAAAALTIGACVPEAPPTSTTSTTTTSTPTSTVETLDNVSLDWTISQETNNGSFAPGQVNFWNAGATPATDAASYLAIDGDVTIKKKNASGTYVNIGSETAVNYANKNRNGLNAVVTATNANFLDQKVVLSGGDGTLNTATGVSTVQWDGTFTINFYGIYVPFQVADPKLTVNAAGLGTLTATLSGIAKSMEDPEAPGTVLPPTEVTLATLPNVYASGSLSTGFTNAPTSYVGTAVTIPSAFSPQAAQTPQNSAYWGSWPQSFVDFQLATGLSSYWYTSGLSTDALKATAPVTVAYNVAP
jgi:hypothetical protein